MYWLELIDCEAMENRATAAYGRWCIADMPTSGADQNQTLFLFNTDHSRERGA